MLPLESIQLADYWAKTDPATGLPALTVRDHCLIVGAVAEAVHGFLPASCRHLPPVGAVTLAAVPLKDLAPQLYGLPRCQPPRHSERAPEDFYFQLTAEEKAEVVANCDHLKTLKFCTALPHAFTEHSPVFRSA